MDTIQLRKQPKTEEELKLLSKEDLIRKIQSLEQQNLQLKNLLNKKVFAAPEGSKSKRKFDFSRCNFRHVLLKFYYLGWDYQGYAKQDDTTNTIEHYLFEALLKTCLIESRAYSNYHRCGRTDKGVSAFSQVVSIDLRSKLAIDKQSDVGNEIEYCKVLNKVLPENIQCVAWCPVNNNISARFDCKSRTYKYFFPKDNLNIESMNEACLYLVGSHDFRNFCKMDVSNGVVQYIRNILSIQIELLQEESKSMYNIYIITIKGQAFLWHQIRCIIGVLFLIGQNKESPNVIKELLDIESNSRKPDYSMASEIPLNLYFTDYDLDGDWYIDKNSLNLAIKKLQSSWMYNAIKCSMMMSMLNDLSVHANSEGYVINNLIDNLLHGVKAKTYVPIMKRQKCKSLENRIEHYLKKRRLEVVKDV